MSTAPTPLVHIVVLNYNGMRFLKECFDSLLATTYQNVELVLLDNNSTDESVGYISKNYPSTRIIQTGINGGYSLAYNVAFDQCKGTYLVMLNNDVKVRSGWLEPMVAACEADHNIAAAQPKLLSMHDTQMFEYAGACGGFLDKYGYPFARGRVFFTLEKDTGQYDDMERIFWATGAAMFIRISALKHSGNLDKDFVHHMEEIDLCWRMNLAGYKLVVTPKSIVEHYGGATIIPDSYRKTYWNHRNSIFMLYKNLERKNLLPLLIRHILLDEVASFFYLFNFKFAKVWAVQAAHYWILTHLGMLRRKRRETQAMRKVSDTDIFPMVYQHSIAFRYFLYGEKTFNQIMKKHDENK